MVAQCTPTPIQVDVVDVATQIWESQRLPLTYSPTFLAWGNTDFNLLKLEIGKKYALVGCRSFYLKCQYFLN